jgi:hypothetical protein
MSCSGVELTQKMSDREVPAQGCFRIRRGHIKGDAIALAARSPHDTVEG